MQFSYSVKNLRRLKDIKPIEIRPITILLGRNSVGKSTFLRTFPLLRQSIETKSSAPILWYGDYVDFGSFRSAVSDQDVLQSISFRFDLRDLIGKSQQAFDLPIQYNALRRRSNRIKVKKIRLSYEVDSTNDSTERTSITIELPDRSLSLHLRFDSGGTFVNHIQVNEFDLTEMLAKYEIYFPPSSLFATPHFFDTIQEDKLPKLRLVTSISIFSRLVEARLSGVVDARTSQKRLQSETRRILRYSSLTDNVLLQLERAETATFRKIYEDMKEGRRSELRSFLSSLCEIKYLFENLEVANNSLSDLFSAVEYIGPARARSERYYRQQELEVSEISPDGRNLPMFLASLTSSQMDDFSNWVKRAFGYGVKVYKTEGHISINLDQSGRSINVVDTGYGVSQVLPVLAQIWWMQFADREKSAGRPNDDVTVKTLAIEQPELHLHPAHQALLADVFVEAHKTAQSNRGQVQCYIVETHSEALVNRLGELIEAGDIDAGDVQIVIFGDELSELEGSNVTISNFDSSGVLQNWPYGFFNFG